MLQSSFAELALPFNLALGLTLAWGCHFVSMRQCRSRYSGRGDLARQGAQGLASQELGLSGLALLAYGLVLSLAFNLSLLCFSGTLAFKQLALEPLSLSLASLSYLASALAVLFSLSQVSRSSSWQGSGDFVTALWQLLLLSPVALMANNLLSFFFFLELLSASTMFMLLASRESFCPRSPLRNLGRQFFGTIFFQFWASFFSSALLFFAIVSLSSCFGTTEWAPLDLLVESSLSRLSGPTSFSLMLSLYAALLGVLVKLGASPFFFYKLEMYNGLPLVPLFFYSVSYFVSFVLALSLVLCYYFPALTIAVLPGLSAYLVLSIVALVSSIFSFPSLRAFFAISSLLSFGSILFLLLSLGH